MERHKTGLIITFLSAIAYGLYPPAAKLAYTDGANVTFVAIVNILARAVSLICLAIYRKQKLLPSRAELASTISGGGFQALSILAILLSLTYLPAPVAMILLFTHTLMLLLFLVLRGEQALTRLSLFSTVLALFGLTLVVDLWQGFSDLSVIGILIALGAAVVTMSRLYIFGKQVATIDPAVVGARTFSVAAVFSIVLLFFQPFEPPVSTVGMFWLALCSISLILGTIGMFFGIAYLGSFQYSLMVKVEPVFTSIFSWLILGEILSPGQYLGMFLVLGSLAGYQYFEGRNR